jgi:prephenate dehydratase
VQNGTAQHGVVPFENSSNGSVVFTLDLLAGSAHPAVRVCGEAYVRVVHCLLGHACPHVQPGDFSNIKKIYSHPQAWGQCKQFLETRLRGVERADVSSTSRAAEIVAADKTGESAALSSGVAAGVFGLRVLVEGVNDAVGNATRFLVLQHSASPSPSPKPKEGKQKYKSLVTFTLDHANPGALAQCLAVFARHGINLTSINTRPSGERNWHYVFFVEFEGRKEEEGKGSVNAALSEMDGVCKGWKWLGSWEDGL